MKVLLDIPNEHIDNAMPQLLAECESEERVSLMNKLCDEAKTSDEPVEIDLSCLGEEYKRAMSPLYDSIAMSTIAHMFYKELCRKEAGL